jgi:hypothetical protein
VPGVPGVGVPIPGLVGVVEPVEGAPPPVF